jgi:tetratricopeptide (TPR) repeat protein
MKKFQTLFTFLFIVTSLVAQDGDSDFYSQYISAMQNGQIQTAIVIGEKWKLNDSENIDAYYLTAKALVKKGRKNEAIQNLNQALEIDSAHVPSLLASAELLKASNDNALELYEKLIILNPTNAYFYREAAESAVASQKLDKALAYYSLAYQNDSLDLITLTGFARLLMDFRQYTDADSLLNRVLEIDPSNRFSRLTKAKIAFESEKWEEVLEWLEPLMSDTPPLTTMRYSGISLYHLGRYEEAIEVLRTLSNVLNELDYPHYYMGLSMEKLGQIDMATVQYGQALNKALSGNLGTYYERLGLVQQATGDHKEAIDSFLMAKKFSGRNIMNFHLAKSYDVYYQDQKMALDMFATFISQEDTLESPEKEYAQARISQLKKDRHFEGN